MFLEFLKRSQLLQTTSMSKMVDAGPDRNITGFYAEAGRTTSNGIRKSRGTSFISELGAIMTSGDMPD
jgi:hypothetical protein